MTPTTLSPIIDSGKQVVATESAAIAHLSSRIDHHFEQACNIILQTQGRVVVSGMGKSGHIGKKIAATLASTGTPAFFVHPGEANHGDLGMIKSTDTVIAISNSGETGEILSLLPLLKRRQVPLIALCGKPHSSLAQYATTCLDVSVEHEACPLGLAPTTSTTATLVMGDALAIALLKARGFESNDFALFHPGGSLGRKLLLKVHSIMHTGEAIPQVCITASVHEALLEMTQKRLGMTTVIDADNKLQGIFADGDLRRTLDKHQSLRSLAINEVMTQDFVSIDENTLAADALTMMQEKQITSLVVTNSSHDIKGVIHLHDILKAGVS